MVGRYELPILLRAKRMGGGLELRREIWEWYFRKRGDRNPVGMPVGNDPGGKAYQDSDGALKTNERAVAENMPLLRGVYQLWGLGNRLRKTARDGVKPSNKHGDMLLH